MSVVYDVGALIAAEEAHDIFALAGKSSRADVVDVHVVAVASRHAVGIVTSDENDLRPIVAVLPAPIPLFTR